MGDNRAFVAGAFQVELDGINAGWVNNCEGGMATAEVIKEKLPGEHGVKCHLGTIKYEDLSLKCGTGMSKGFYQWLKDTLDAKYSRKNGRVVAADYNFNMYSELSFYNALITEFGMPALDGSSKDACAMSIKFAPEYTRFKKASGKLGAPIKAAVQKRWVPSNFRLRIDGINEPCLKTVNKIEALVCKQKVVEAAHGEQRDYQREPTSIELPNLVFTLAENHGDDFYKWHEDFVIKGNCGEDKEKKGTIEYLTPDLSKTLFTVRMDHIGVFKCTPDKVEARNEQIRRLKIECYVEDFAFEYSGDACM